MIKEARWSGWVWVGECFFWYRPTRVVPDQRPLNGRRCCCCCPGLPKWAGTRKVKPLDFTEARDSEWQWHRLGHMQVCTSLQTDNHASTPPLSFFYRPDALLSAQPTTSKYCRCICLLCCCRAMRRYFRPVWVSWPRLLKLRCPQSCPLEREQLALSNVIVDRHCLLELAAIEFYHSFHSYPEILHTGWPLI